MKNLIILLIALILLSCNCKNSLRQTEEVPIIKLNATKKENLRLPLSSVEIIQLETTSDSKIPYIQKAFLDHENDRLFILSDCNIYIFNKNGKYISKLIKGHGPGEILQISSFAIDSKNKIIYALDNARNIVNYDYSGKFRKKIQIDSFYSSDIFSQDSNNIYLVCNYVGKSEKNFVGKFDLSENKITEKFIPISYSPYSISTNLMVQNSFFFKGDRVLFFNPNIFGIFQYNNGSFVQTLSFDLGNRQVPIDFSKRFTENNRSAFRDEAKKRDYVPVLMYTFYFNGYYLIGIDDENFSCYAVNSKKINEVFKNDSFSSYFGLPDLASLKFPPVGFQKNMILLGCDASDFFDKVLHGRSKKVLIANKEIDLCIDDNPILIAIR